jgi:DNA-binding SARP family transcriptional activator
MDALYYLLNFYQYHKEYSKAIRWGQRILLADPLREDVHRDLMRLFVQNGQRALAVRQYQRCQQILEAELSIEPMPETQLVYERIVGRQRARSSEMEGSMPLAETLKSLQSAMDSICQAQRDLHEVLTRLNK